jgi:RNA-directed DNA polymerase
VETNLAKIAKVVREKPGEKLTSLAHFINADTLREAHFGQDGKKAVGVDAVTKAEYEVNLEDNLADLVKRMKRQAYKPQPVRRAYIRKEGTDKLRPLGIPAYEDKLVQSVLADILSTIYEEIFLPFSFGFRPGRGCMLALQVLNHIIEGKAINYVVDADIKGFFDNVNHEWLVKFLQHRIADPSLLRLIQRFLRAGVMEGGVRHETLVGTPQGGLISPVMANVYLHYVLDLWFQGVVRKQCKGAAYIVRYADDFVCCFEFKEDATTFYEALVERLEAFGLQVAAEKTKIIRFGRPRDDDDERPGTFDFLGFTHFCGQSKKGKFRVKRQTAKKKLRRSIQNAKVWLRENMHRSMPDLMRILNAKLRGHYEYYGITDNSPSINLFYDRVKRMLKWTLGRRSQRGYLTETHFAMLLQRFPLVLPRIRHSIYG